MRRLATLGIVVAAAALTALGQASGLTITTTSLPAAVYNQPYTSFTLTTSGDAGPITWSLVLVPSSPQPFAVASGSTATTGTFCYGTSGPSGPQCANPGTPVLTPVGSYTAIIQAKSLSTNQTATRQYSFLVINSPVQITSTSLPNAVANQAYSTQIQTFGGTGQFSWSIPSSSGSLPPGMALDQTGTISGKAPAVNASYSFTVQLQDQGTQPPTILNQAFTINVVQGVTTVTITTTALPDGTQLQAYPPDTGVGFQLTGTGQNLVWSLSAATPLPSALSLSSSGVISGIPISLGITVLQIQVANAQVPAANAQQQFTLRVTLGPLGINETALPAAIQNAAYSTTLTPAGGIPPYVWSLDPSAPAGLSIDPKTGVLSGTLTTAKSFPVTVILSDCGPLPLSAGPSCPQRTVSQNYTLKVVSPTLTIINTSLLPDSQGTPYADTLTATGGTLPYRWSVTAGNLPAGLSLGANTGLITGTPTTQAASTFTITVTDSSTPTALTASKVLTIGPALAITSTSLPGAGLGQLYSATIATVGGVQPFTWTVASGNLPAGLQLNGATISGTPTALGSSNFTILVTDSGTGVARQNFTINVANPIVITSGDFSTPVLAALSPPQTLAATGGTPPYTWSVTAGTLPPGLQLNSATGVISGTPGGAGASQVEFTARDINGLTGKKTINITITQPPAPPTSIKLGATTQPTVSLSIGTPYPLDITGVLTLTFAPAPGVVGTPTEVRFAPSGSTTLPFTVPATQTNATFTGTPAIMTGTVAGTITLTASLSAGGLNITPSPAPTTTITFAPAVPVISVALHQVTGGLNVVVTGYSNTREVSSGSFTFTVSSGNTLTQATIPVTLTSAYAAWFGNTSSNATGGQFKLTVPFSVTQGAATAVTGVSVTLTNGQGVSPAVSAAVSP